MWNRWQRTARILSYPQLDSESGTNLFHQEWEHKAETRTEIYIYLVYTLQRRWTYFYCVLNDQSQTYEAEQTIKLQKEEEKKEVIQEQRVSVNWNKKLCVW